MTQASYDEARDRYFKGAKGDSSRCKRPSEAMRRQVLAEKNKSQELRHLLGGCHVE